MNLRTHKQENKNETDIMNEPILGIIFIHRSVVRQMAQMTI